MIIENMFNYKKARKIFLNSSEQNQEIAKSISFIAVFKAGNLLFNFLIIPLTINYVNSSVYGIWLTMYSIISWISIFDIGLGNGLRNNLTKCLSLNKLDDAKRYVSTTYCLLVIIAFIILIVFGTLSWLINWNHLLNIPSNFDENIHATIFLLICTFCLRFVFQIISVIFFSIQKSHYSEIMLFISNLLVLIFLFIIRNTMVAKLSLLVLVLTIPSILMMILFSLFLFNSVKYKAIRPKFAYFDKNIISGLNNLGLKFFVLQISSLVTYSLSNLIIMRLLTPEDVTLYNVSYKYFSAILILNNIICIPLWSAFTKAYVNNDILWIKSVIRNFFKLFALWVILGVLMLVFSSFIYFQWIRVDLNIPFMLSLIMFLFMLVCSWNGIFIAFINGVGKIRLQVFVSLIPIVFMIPFCYITVRYFSMGVVGVALPMLFFNLLSSTIATIQVFKIINRKATGIWDQ